MHDAWTGRLVLAALALATAETGAAQDNAMNNLPCLPSAEDLDVISTFWKHESIETLPEGEVSGLVDIGSPVLGALPASAILVRPDPEGKPRSISFLLAGPLERHSASILAAFGAGCDARGPCSVQPAGGSGSLARMTLEATPSGIRLTCAYRPGG